MEPTDNNTVSNSELQDGNETLDSNLELLVEPEISGRSGIIIDPDVSADDDSDCGPQCHPDDNDISSSETEVAED